MGLGNKGYEGRRGFSIYDGFLVVHAGFGSTEQKLSLVWGQLSANVVIGSVKAPLVKRAKSITAGSMYALGSGLSLWAMQGMKGDE